MVKVGIISCGRIAKEWHLPEYVANSDTIIAGVFDLNQEKTTQITEQYGAVPYDSYEKLLANPEIEADSVCAANHTRFDKCDAR